MIQSLDKALSLLSLFTITRPELTLAQIVELSGLQKSSVYKILQTFVENGYLYQDNASKKYRLGNKIAVLSNAFFKRNSVSLFISEKLRQAANETGENLYYAIPYDLEVLYIDFASPIGALIEPSSRGATAPISCTALGKAILAFSKEEYLMRVIESGLIKSSSSSITNKEEYLAEIKKTKDRGYAIDDMEHKHGIRCISVPICKGDFAVGAISISGPSLRFPEEKIEEYAQLLLEIKKEAEMYL